MFEARSNLHRWLCLSVCWYTICMPERMSDMTESSRNFYCNFKGMSRAITYPSLLFCISCLTHLLVNVLPWRILLPSLDLLDHALNPAGRLFSSLPPLSPSQRKLLSAPLSTFGRPAAARGACLLPGEEEAPPPRAQSNRVCRRRTLTSLQHRHQDSLTVLKQQWWKEEISTIETLFIYLMCDFVWHLWDMTESLKWGKYV